MSWIKKFAQDEECGHFVDLEITHPQCVLRGPHDVHQTTMQPIPAGHLMMFGVPIKAVGRVMWRAEEPTTEPLTPEDEAERAAMSHSGNWNPNRA